MKIWQQALDISAQTPADRNRYVDFLRALSILVVVTGHWLIAGFQMVEGSLISTNVLQTSPGTQWLTWICQVMPLFFIVGGYANAVSLQSAARKQQGYGEWLSGRLRRLLFPLLGLCGGWAIISLGLYSFGLPAETIQQITKTALIPIWFLAIYIVVVMLAPITFKAWQKFGPGSILLLAALAILTDIISFNTGFSGVGWSNYFWVWLAVHQLGYAWRTGRIPAFRGQVFMSLCGWIALALLIFVGPYPLAMVGSPDPEISNTLSPKVTLLALAVAQFGLVLCLTGPMNRLLGGLRTWAATVLVNSMIMTLYLWHITVLLIVVGTCYLLSGFGLEAAPGSDSWWFGRLPWMAVLYGLLLPVTLLLAPIEQYNPGGKAVTSGVRQVVGALMACAGIAQLALWGVSPLALGLVFLGSAIAGILYRFKLAPVSTNP